MKGSWIFFTLSKTATEQVKQLNKAPRRGFGSVRVRATIGQTTWDTSIFPDKTRGYVLPVKAKVRKKEGVGEGDTVTVTLVLT